MSQTTDPDAERADRESVSIVLPTLEWGVACEQVAAQLRPGDELLVVCDRPDDPVASHNPPAGVEILVAGEPERCSAKANAIAYAMERASNDRFVWSDDDYERDDDWLDRLVVAGQDHGPAAYLPILVPDGWSGRLWSPMNTMFFGLRVGLYFGSDEDGFPWGGGVTFTREDLDASVEQLAAELRQCLADDAVLHDHVGDAYMLRSNPVRVPVDGDFRDTSRRLLRYMRVGHVRGGNWPEFLVSLCVVALAMPLAFLIAPLITAFAWVGYRRVGKQSWTFLLAYPSLFTLPFVFGASILLTEFTWGRRRYRVTERHGVEIVDHDIDQ